MKKLLLLISVILIATACDSEPEKQLDTNVAEKVVDSIQMYEGDFISVGKSAVLKGDSFVYQVKMDSIAFKLQDSLNAFKKNDNGIIPVRVKGEVKNNIHSTGYSNIIEISEVIDIMANPIIENE